MKEFAGKNFLLIVENNAVPFDKRVWREARALQDAGADVSVVCPIFGTDNQRFTLLEGIEVHRYPLKFSDGTSLGYVKEYAAAFFHTVRLFHQVLLKKKRIHVVHVANPPDIFWPLALYIRLFRSRFIFDEHDLTPETFLSRFEKGEQNGGIMFKLLRLFQLLSYRFAHATISTNETYRERAVRVNPRYSSKTFVVRNGPDTRYFNSRPANPALKQGFTFMAAYIGIMAVQDGVDYVIRALNILVNKKGFDQLIVYLIGTGDDVPRLKELVHEYNLDRYVVFTGRIPDEPALEILSTADICLSPDPYNPLNDSSTMNKIMEYMSLGKPIVSFDLKEARYSAQGAALYVVNNDDLAFAEGILRLLSNSDQAEQMGAVGRKRVNDILCWQKQTEHLYRAYRWVLSGMSHSSHP
jgi:glycosyltransferase involved in cell wall biosynthesis